MRIISQDKNTNINYDTCTIVKKVNDNDMYLIQAESHMDIYNYVLGEYTTKEQVNKVFASIINAGAKENTYYCLPRNEGK